MSSSLTDVCVCAVFQFPITALREIKILQLLKHENVVNLIEICRTKGWCYMSPYNDCYNHPSLSMCNRQK